MSEQIEQPGTEPTAGDPQETPETGAVEEEPAVTDDGDPQASAEPEAAQQFDRKRFEAELRKKNSEAANLRKRLRELEPLANKAREIEEAQKTEAERLASQLAEAQQQITVARQHLVEARVQALAARQAGDRPAFVDPEDAVTSLDLTQYIDDSGVVDEAAIEADLQELLARKPHWAKSAPPPEGPRRPAPDRTQASGANRRQAPNPSDEFAGWLSARLNGRGK